MENCNEVSKDTVYSEFYAEMRRFRDYELTISTWYTAILLAVLGAILTFKFGPTSSELSHLLRTNLLIKILLAGVSSLIGISGLCSVIYASRRYHELREYVDKNLEPKWKKFKPEYKKWGPRQAILMTFFILIIITDIVALW